jgi:hypothetical protein
MRQPLSKCLVIGPALKYLTPVQLSLNHFNAQCQAVPLRCRVRRVHGHQLFEERLSHGRDRASLNCIIWTTCVPCEGAQLRRETENSARSPVYVV